MTTQFTEQEQSILSTLPPQVQQILSEHPSVAENYLSILERPDLPKDSGCSSVCRLLRLRRISQHLYREWRGDSQR